MKSNHTILALLLIACPIASVFALDNEISVGQAQTDAHEQNDRVVDQAVLMSKKNAITSLQRILSQRRSPDEPRLLMNLAEIQRNCAEYEFRIAHGKAIELANQKILLEDYRKMLADSVGTLNKLLTNYPTFKDAVRAVFMRGKAFAELGRSLSAIADYNYVIGQKQKSKAYNFAIVSLVDLLMDEKNYAGVIQQYVQAHAQPTDDYYPILLDRAAFAYYSLGNFPSALQFAEAEIRFFRTKSNLNKTDSADLEKILNNVVLFYSAGVIAKSPTQTPENAFGYFERIGGRTQLTRMLSSFGYLLRSKGLDNELETVKRTVIASNLSPLDKAEVLFVVFENEINRRSYAAIQDSSAALQSVFAQYSSQGSGAKLDDKKFSRLNKSLSEASETFQKEFVSNPNSPNRTVIASALKSVYRFLLVLDGGHDKKADKTAKIYTNLAEIDFALKDYAGATRSYRWVVSSQGVSRALDAALKSISSRYEELSGKNLLPKDLVAHAMNSNLPVALPAESQEWISWIDDYASEVGSAYTPHSAELQVFQFEANRLLYASGQLEESFRRSKKFMAQYPNSKYAAAAAALMLDTYVAGQDWPKVRSITQNYLSKAEFKNAVFLPQMARLLEDSSYKLIEIEYRAKNYSSALEEVQKYIAEHPTSKYREDCVAMAANASLAMGNKAQAVSFFSQLHDFSKSGLKSTSILTSATLAEENGNLAEAKKNYLMYLALPSQEKQLAPTELDKIREKVLVYEFFTGDYASFPTRVSTMGLCSGFVAAECDKYRTLSLLYQKNDTSKRGVRDAFNKALVTSNDPNAPVIWAAMALDRPQFFSISERYRLIEGIENQYEKMDSVQKFSVIPILSRGIIGAVTLTQSEIAKSSTLKLDKNSIAARAKLMEELATRVGGLSKLPYASIRAHSLLDVASLYDKFSEELKNLPKPKGAQGDEIATYDAILAKAAQPFKDKALELQKSAEQIGLYAKGDGLELQSDLFASLAKPPLGVHPIYQAWSKAVQDKRLPSVVFYTQQLKDRKLIDSSSEPIVEAAGLIASSSPAEAIIVLKAANEQGQIKDNRIAEALQHSVSELNRAPAQVNPQVNPETKK